MNIIRLVIAAVFLLSISSVSAIAAEEKAGMAKHGMMEGDGMRAGEMMEQGKMMAHDKMIQDALGMMKEMMLILKDLNHSPTAEQKKRLKEMAAKMDDMMKNHEEMKMMKKQDDMKKKKMEGKDM